MKAMIMGQYAGVIQIKGKEYPTRLTTSAKSFNSLDKIRYFSPSSNIKRTYLDQVSTINSEHVTGLIKRVNRKRMITISADLEGVDLQTASQMVTKRLGQKFNDKNMKWKIGGADQQRKESEKSLIGAVILSIFLIYLLLASQFENFRQPFIILFAVPLCVIGVAVLLLVLNMNISALVFVGFIILAGISVNTSIILVETINQNVLTGMEMQKAIVHAARNRLRPILMTAMSTIIGLLPMAIATGQGAGMRQPLAITVIGGLISSTLLTVIVVPLIFEKISKKLAT